MNPPRQTQCLPALVLRRWAWSFLLAASACTADTSATAPSQPSTRPNPPPGVPNMAFETVGMTLKGKAFTMEVAERSAQIERGLMYRDAMDPDHGMLFVFDEPSITAFWMANTRIPLDIIFLDKTARVMEIHQRKPFDEESRGPARPVQYVIELNVGMAEKIGLKTGDQIEIPRKYLKTAAAPSD